MFNPIWRHVRQIGEEMLLGNISTNQGARQIPKGFALARKAGGFPEEEHLENRITK
jgi:hypothetical protein